MAVGAVDDMTGVGEERRTGLVCDTEGRWGRVE
jgi:hypothetical protein